jgi:hypothetical protein
MASRHRSAVARLENAAVGRARNNNPPPERGCVGERNRLLLAAREAETNEPQA